jgi:hypothetical protein
MNESPRISPLPPAYRSQDFDFLRAEAMDVVRTLAAESWTDHNLHDPGVTLLEAACYALTEAGLRAGMDVADLLASSGAQRSPELFTAAQVLPSAAVTATDLRKVLLDHPLVGNVWVSQLLSPPLGRARVLLELADDALNGNIIVEPLSPHAVALAFPHWDDEDARPFREPVRLDTLALIGAPANAWNRIEGSTAFFARAEVGYRLADDTPRSAVLRIVAYILGAMADPTAEAPVVLDAVAARLADLGADGPLNAFNRRVTGAYETMRLIRLHALAHRNLGEAIAEFNAVRLQEVGVTAIVEIGSGVDAEELLAEAFLRIDRMISPTVRFGELGPRLYQMGSADAVFDGPLTDAGFVDAADLGAHQPARVLYTSDFLRLLYQLRGADGSDVVAREDVAGRRIIAVRSLALSNFIDNRPITTGARDCLRLVNSTRHVPRLSVEKSRIVLFRNGVEIPYDAGRVALRFRQRKAGEAWRDRRSSLDLPIPMGEAFAVGEHYPIQNDLPAAYGVGEAGLPEHATTERRAQARQLKGYLFFFEQMLAGYQAQLAGFNTFFSSDPAVGRTLFQQPLYPVPDIAPLLKAFDPRATSWDDFRADETHGYARVLAQAVESPAEFAERRNAVLDHLLATLGEQMHDRAALLFRLAATQPPGEPATLPELLAARERRRLDALRELIRDKARYYRDVPELNRTRAQACGHPLWRAPRLGRITRAGDPAEWEIVDRAGVPRFRQATVRSSLAARYGPRRTMELALQLATRAEHYFVEEEDVGRHRLEVRSSDASDPVAESVASHATAAEAEAAIAGMVDEVVALWTAHALIPLEWRLYHLLGIDVHERRRLVHDAELYIEIQDVPGAANHEKLFRIWGQAGFAGELLLIGVDEYPGVDDADATARARAAAEQAAEQGTLASSYRIDEVAGAFAIVLAAPDGTPLARSAVAYGSPAEATEAAAALRERVFHVFSGEGCFLVEHHLLFDADTAGAALEVPGQADPYSFQLTVVVPSGYARDFTNPASERQPVRPALYRNEEFRRYAEQQVRRFCPAHLLPRVLWIDRAQPGTAVGADDPSLDAFEQAYFAWLRAGLADQVDASTVAPLRDALTNVLNALYQEHYAD